MKDNPEHRTLLHEVVEPLGFRARDFVSSEELLAVYDRVSLGIVVLDLRLPEEDMGRTRKADALQVLRMPIKGPIIIANPNPGMKARFGTLDPGELAVLEGMREGLRIKQIAERCAISERTARRRVPALRSTCCSLPSLRVCR